MRLLSAILVMSLLLAAGCGGPNYRTPGYSAVVEAQELARGARQDAAKLPDSPEKAALVARLDALDKQLAGQKMPTEAQVADAVQWYDLFGPKSVSIHYFTKFTDVGGGKFDTLEARLLLQDRFGDPVKALGSFRIETFDYVARSLEKRGAQVNNWYVSVLTAKDVQKYFDSRDRTYVFPLRVTHGFAGDRAIVQVTYYLPDGSGRKMFGERVIKIGG